MRQAESWTQPRGDRRVTEEQPAEFWRAVTKLAEDSDLWAPTGTLLLFCARSDHLHSRAAPGTALHRSECSTKQEQVNLVNRQGTVWLRNGQGFFSSWLHYRAANIRKIQEVECSRSWVAYSTQRFMELRKKTTCELSRKYSKLKLQHSYPSIIINFTLIIWKTNNSKRYKLSL